MTIDQLIAQGNKCYALSSYEEAADKYAQASEEVSKANGEDSPRNADVMFLYGRTLFKIAMQKSQVLGAGSGEVPQHEVAKKETDVGSNANAANFSFEGDAAEDDDEFEDVPAQQDADATSEDDFQTAWEILDLARLSYRKQIDSKQDTAKEEMTKRLAETYDILGEIALENENFDQAVADLKEALNLKQSVHDESSSQISGAHYMLALALEYCTSSTSRSEAADEVRAAIVCFEKRIATKSEDTQDSKEELEMLEELRLKLSELEAKPETIKKEEIAEIFGKEGTALKESLVQAMQNSNDLTGLVRRREKKQQPGPDAEHPTSKKARVEEIKDEEA